VSLRAILAVVLAVGLAAPAHGQIPLVVPIPLGKARPAPGALPGPPEDLPPAEAEIWPFPPPDPMSWWTENRLKTPEAADPLGGRRVRRGEALPRPANGVAPSTYRLWGLMPLQWQVLREDEMILEAWVRPADTVRQAVVRIVVRRDGDAFVQARAGLACCDALIGRRMGFDAALPAGSAGRFRALAKLPAWSSPKDVQVEEAGAVGGLCVKGVAYDLTLVARDWSRSLRRACDPAAVGEAADVLEPVIAAALGHDARFDVLFPKGADFGAERRAWRRLIEGGGRLAPDPKARAAAPGDEPAPGAEPEAPTPPAPAPQPAPPA
jgi:hypothetical protein